MWLILTGFGGPGCPAHCLACNFWFLFLQNSLVAAFGALALVFASLSWTGKHCLNYKL